jgi:hypothetical protein
MGLSAYTITHYFMLGAITIFPKSLEVVGNEISVSVAPHQFGELL